MKQLIRNLEHAFDQVREINLAYHSFDKEERYFAALDCTALADEAAALASRQGCGEAVRGLLTPGEALRFIGRLIAWAKADHLLTVPQVAVAMGVSEDRVYEWTRNAKRKRAGKPVTGPVIDCIQYKPGGKILFERASLAAFRSRYAI